MDRGALWATVFGVIRVRLNLETKQQQQWHSYHCLSAKQRDSSWLDAISLEGMILERTWRFRMKALLAVGGSTASVILRCLSMDGDQLGTKFHWSMVQWEDKDTVMKFAWSWISSSEKAVLYLIWCLLSSVQFSSVIQLCLTLCNLMNHSTPGLPVHPQLPEFTQTHVHNVGDAIQPSHPLSSPSPPALNLSQHQGLFKWVSSSHQEAKGLEFQLQHQSFQWKPRTDLLQNGLVGAPYSPRDSQESSPTPHFKSINSSVLSFLYSPALTSIHDYWKNHSFHEIDLS